MGSARADLIPGGGANFLKGAGGQLRAPPRASPRTCPRPPCPPAALLPPLLPAGWGGKIRKSAKIIIIQIIRKEERKGEREGNRGVPPPHAVWLQGGERGHLPAQRAGRVFLPPRSRRTPSLQRCAGDAGGRPVPVPTPTRGVSRRGRQPWSSAREARPSRPLRHGAGAERRRGWDGTGGGHLPPRAEPRAGHGAE